MGRFKGFIEHTKSLVIAHTVTAASGDFATLHSYPHLAHGITRILTPNTLGAVVTVGVHVGHEELFTTAGFYSHDNNVLSTAHQHHRDP